jgi:hypothetical protein
VAGKKMLLESVALLLLDVSKGYARLFMVDTKTGGSVQHSEINDNIYTLKKDWALNYDKSIFYELSK